MFVLSKELSTNTGEELGEPAEALEPGRLPVNKHHPIGYFLKSKTTDVESQKMDVETRKLNEITELLYLPKSLSQTELNAHVVRAVEMFDSLNPQDGAESMLATQMVGTHYTALECLRRAAIPDQSFEAQDMVLRHAHKLLALYAKQLETLNKHRGNGQQNITVRHFNVEPDGQVAVRNFEAGLKTNPLSNAAQIADESGVPMEPVMGNEISSPDKVPK